MELRKAVEKEFWFQTISNATYSVDTFFFIRSVFRFNAISIYTLVLRNNIELMFLCFLHFIFNIHLLNIIAVFLCHTCISEPMQKEN